MSLARRRRSPAPPPPDATWNGPTRSYDLVKELAIALLVVAALAVALTVLFSSPDERPTTIAQWSQTNPSDFATTAVGELAGTSAIAGYGPPYNHAASGQHVGPIRLQKWLGVSHPIDPARDFVIDPLSGVPGDQALHAALAAYQAAPPAQQAQWTDAYAKAAAQAHDVGGTLVVPPGPYGPVAPLMASLYGLARSGGLDGALLTEQGKAYQVDFTKPLLMLSDGSALSDRAQAQHLLGSQWGMMNETGSYPGQVWLWLYTFWYQIKPFSTSPNADALVWMVMAVLSLAFICVPFIPGVRSVPRWIPLHRLIWRVHYRAERAGPGSPA